MSKAFLAMLDRESKSDLDLWEKDLTHEQDLDDWDDDMVNRAIKLYNCLVSYLKGRRLSIVRAVDTSDGLKAWPQLCPVNSSPNKNHVELDNNQGFEANSKFCRHGWPYGGGSNKSPTLVEKPPERKGAERKRQAKRKRSLGGGQGNGTGNK